MQMARRETTQPAAVLCLAPSDVFYFDIDTQGKNIL